MKEKGLETHLVQLGVDQSLWPPNRAINLTLVKEIAGSGLSASSRIRNRAVVEVEVEAVESLTRLKRKLSLPWLLRA